MGDPTLSKRSHRPWPDKDKQFLREQWLSGKSASYLAGYFDRSLSSVQAKLAAMGIHRRRQSRFTLEQIDVIKSMWGLDYSVNRIAETIGVTRNSVIGKAHRLGLPRRASPIRR